MVKKFVIQIFLAYVAIVLFLTILLSLKFLSDLSDCSDRKDKDITASVYPHDTGRENYDPWNVNDHPVSYNHDNLREKKKRDLAKPIIIPPQKSTETKNVKYGEYYMVKVKVKCSN